MAWSFVNTAETRKDYRGHTQARIILRHDGGEREALLDFSADPSETQLQATIDNLLHRLNYPPPPPPTEEETTIAMLKERLAAADLLRQAVDDDNGKLRNENAALKAENQGLKDQVAALLTPPII